MKKIKKIAIIGHFGGKENFNDGQTVKTVNLYKELLKSTNWKISKVDTYYKSKNPFVLFIKTIISIMSTKNIIVLLSGNGMRFYFPILYLAAKLFHRNIYHDVIGGNLSCYVDKYPRYKRYLNSFKANWVETKRLKTELDERGIINVEIIPNFRRMLTVNVQEIQRKEKDKYRFCTFSRVMQEKGIEEAINSINYINHINTDFTCCLDIYGPIDCNYREKFENLMNNGPENITYKGEVDANQSVEIIKDYYGMLFPTCWSGEGIAGTIIESFFAGVPVIATDWRSNNEVITSGYNGILYPSEIAKNLDEAILWLIYEENNMYQIKKNCIESATIYEPDRYIQHIIEKISLNN